MQPGFLSKMQSRRFSAVLGHFDKSTQKCFLEGWSFYTRPIT